MICRLFKFEACIIELFTNRYLTDLYDFSFILIIKYAYIYCVLEDH